MGKGNHFDVICDECHTKVQDKDYLAIIDNETKIVTYRAHIELDHCPYKVKQGK